MKHPEIWESVRTLMKFRNEAPPFKNIQRSDTIPLSFSQERLWLLDQLNPGTADYNVPYAFRVKGNLNISALEKSFNEIRYRHEILRTTFSTVEGQGVQMIAPGVPERLTIVDLEQYLECDRESKALELVKVEAQLPFDLSCGPLIRTKLIKINPQDYIVMITLHHIIYDAWSDGVLFKELAALYNAFDNDQPSPLTELSIQYADFAIWQRQWLQGEFLNTLLNFWQEKLEGLSKQKLPIDYPEPAVPSGKRARYSLTLSSELTKKINALASAEGITPFILLLAAFKVLLRTYLGQEDIFVCTPIANRNRSEVQKLIGFFVNLLIYRTTLSDNLTVKDVIEQVRQVSAGAYAHQDIPIQLLVSHLNLVNTPLSQIMFALQNVVLQSPKLGDLTVTPLEEQRGTDFDLFLSLEEEGGTLNAVMKYNIDLFAEHTISQMLTQYQTVLEGIVANPQGLITNLVTLNEKEREELCNKLNRTETKITEKATAEKLFIPPRNQLEVQLTKIWQEVLGIQPISINDNFFELGGKSLIAIRLFTKIEDELGIKLPVATLTKAPTIEQLANLLSQEKTSTTFTPLVALQPYGSQPPLFLLPPAACTALHYSDLARHFPSEQPVYALEQLGMDGKEEPHQTVEEMAAYYIEYIKTVQPTGPYLIAGRCMGGIVAFEMALQLQVKGERVAMLGIIDTQSPPRLQRRNLKYYLRELFSRLRRPKFVLSYIETLLTKVKNSRSTDPQDRQIQYVYDTHARARRNYIPKHIYADSIILFKNSEASLDAQAKWAELVKGEVKSILIEGDHKTMLEDPHVETFVAQLKTCIEQAIT